MRLHQLIRFLLIVVLLHSAWSCALAQYAEKTIARLASPSFHGRGYYKNGDAKAAEFISNEFKRMGLIPINGSYYQPFTFPVNTFPGNMMVMLNNKRLSPGADYIVSPACPSVKGTFQVIKVTLPLQEFPWHKHVDDFILIDKSGLDSTGMAIMDSLLRFPPDVKGVIFAEPNKLTWGVSTFVNEHVLIRVLKDEIPQDLTSVTLDIENKYIGNYHTNNVVAGIRGMVYPDSFIVITAHYDHLGRMGNNALFAGANDNASGTAMLLDLANYYIKAPVRPRLSLLFIAFAAEEAGLIGSKYYTENPLLPLEKIRFLINLDLMGNGEDGVMVVNGEVHETEFQLLEKINRKKNLVKEIGKRGKAKNSDHYYFSEKGVPAFFLYTMGGSKAYHDIYDVPRSLKMIEYNDIRKLLTEFIYHIQNGFID